MATIERNANLQAELIEDLLDVSQILQGKLSLNIRPVDLAATIEAAIETVRLAAEAKSIEIETHLPAKSGVLGDATRLQQAFWNLLSNAIKFTPPGGRVEVRLNSEFTLREVQSPTVLNSELPTQNSKLKTQNSYALVTIADKGKGISADFLPHVFDSFRQADGSTTCRFGGLGLGLAIVHQIITLHGGRVWAESPGEGLGSTFTVSLPLTPTQPAIKPDVMSAQSPHLSRVRVLVVDDEADSQEFVAFALDQAGASVITATTASEALAAFTQSPIDILLSDIRMPDMDGYMLVQEIRSRSADQGGNIPAIALTAYAGEIDQQQSLQAGFQRHLSKPIDPQMLVEAISALITSPVLKH